MNLQALHRDLKLELYVTQVLIPTGCWLFHPSWHMCIYKRMFESENKILTKEGVIHFLELYEVKSLPYSPELSEVMTSQPLPL